jgi:hypothetical protein
LVWFTNEKSGNPDLKSIFKSRPQRNTHPDFNVTLILLISLSLHPETDKIVLFSDRVISQLFVTRGPFLTSPLAPRGKIFPLGGMFISQG